jgi:hypothetical protein
MMQARGGTLIVWLYGGLGRYRSNFWHFHGVNGSKFGILMGWTGPNLAFSWGERVQIWHFHGVNGSKISNFVGWTGPKFQVSWGERVQNFIFRGVNGSKISNFMGWTGPKVQILWGERVSGKRGQPSVPVQNLVKCPPPPDILCTCSQYRFFSHSAMDTEWQHCWMRAAYSLALMVMLCAHSGHSYI